MNYPRPQTEACLAALELGWPPEVGGDYPFLESLYIDTRWDEFAAIGWPERPLRTFLAGQYAAQCRHYTQAYRDNSAFQILLHDERSIGRLYLYDAPEDSHLIDITLVASCRGKGIGRALLRALIVDARVAGRTVSIHVESNNPARRLYDRLGFQEAAEAQPPYLLMRTQLAEPLIETAAASRR